MTNGRVDNGITDLAVMQGWADALLEVAQRIGARFARAEAREQALGYLRGLLSNAERKNSWQLAEALGQPTPYGLQHLLGRALWDADQVRDDLQQYVRDYLSDATAVLIVDETGFVKKGRHSAGVARQYSGTAGRVENSQVGVFLAYAGGAGHTLIDRELYLPKEWTNDPVRCASVGIPADRAFATKPALARQMLARALDTGLPAAWVTGDSVYGDDRRLRLWLEERERAYALAVSGKEYVWIGFKQHRVKQVLATLPAEDWIRLSAGAGAKGPRGYDWHLLPLNPPMQASWGRWLLIRRKIEDLHELTAFVVFAPQETTLEDMVRVAGSRWAIEVTFEAAKGEVGLDQYEVRSWTGWYRHTTLAMWAHAYLAAIRTTTPSHEALKKGALLSATRNSLAAFKHRRGLSCG